MFNFTDYNSSSNTSADADNTDGHPTIPVPFWIFLSIETVITILGNAMLCWLFCANRKLRTNQNYFIVSLSVSDLLVGLSIVPCEYCRVGRANLDDKQCPLFCGSVISFNMIASIINLVLISSDRYFSIKKPYLYIRIFTKRRAILIIAIGWFITIALVCLPILWAFEEVIPSGTGQTLNMVYTGILFSLTILAGLLLASSYYTIVVTIRKKVRETRDQPSNPAGIKVCIISSIIFFISWIPYTAVEIMLQSKVTFRNMHAMMDAAYFILILSPCLDPLLYAYYRRDFRSCLVAYYRKNNFGEFGRRVVSHITFARQDSPAPVQRRTVATGGGKEQEKFLVKVQTHVVSETETDSI